jgi:hypothetical protein
MEKGVKLLRLKKLFVDKNGSALAMGKPGVLMNCAWNPVPPGLTFYLCRYKKSE